MKNALPFLLLTVTSIGGGQTSTIQHAPTAAQCHADLRLWWDESRTTIESLQAGTLEEREREMQACASVLQGNEASDSSSLKGIYDGHLAKRMESFLIRHGLLGQFAEEDAKGAR